MSFPVIKTKLTPPQLRQTVVERSRFNAIFESTAGRKLTLLSAPAGYGKSTLIAQGLQEHKAAGTLAWLSLDGTNNDVARFLSDLVAAIRVVHEGVGNTLLTGLAFPEVRPLPLLELVIEELASFPDRLHLVLDDYHIITSAQVHECVAFFLKAMPQNIHVILASRHDPLLPMARWRAQNEVVELRDDDLRFTLNEAAQFFQVSTSVEMTDEEVTAIVQKTEGWIAALQLAAMKFHKQSDVLSLIHAFPKNSRHLFDFLTEEVFQQLSGRIQRFLLFTSIPDRFCADLGVALTVEDDDGDLLENLARNNLLVASLDGEGRWFRYHHLFRDYLRTRLQREYRNQVGELNLRASQWFEKNGYVPEAVTHALSSTRSDENDARTGRLVEVAVKDALAHGEFATVLRWTEAMSDKEKRQRPRLFAVQAVALTLGGQLDKIDSLLCEVEEAALTTGHDSDFLLGYVLSIRAWVALSNHELTEAIAFAEQALTVLPEHEHTQRSFAFAALGEALRLSGELKRATDALQETVQVSKLVNHTYGTLTGMVWHARALADQGQLKQAEEAFHQTLLVGHDLKATHLPVAAFAHTGLAAIVYERGMLGEVETELGCAIALAEKFQAPRTLIDAYILRSKLHRARGQSRTAQKDASLAVELTTRAGLGPDAVASACYRLLEVRLESGDLDGAHRAGRKLQSVDALTEQIRFKQHLALAKLNNAEGDFVAALKTLAAVSSFALRPKDRITVEVLRALVLWSKSDKALAVDALLGVLKVSQPLGYLRTIIDQNNHVGDVLTAAFDRQKSYPISPESRISTIYFTKLLATVAPNDREGTMEHESAQLSQRELDVLTLVAAGRSTKQIATQLAISPGTVKTHLNSLYRKLGVHSRTQAIARAREVDYL